MLPVSKNKMNKEIVEIEIYNKEEDILSTICVEQLSENKFRTTANELIDIRLTYKTEFETIQNVKKQHEIYSVTKNTNFITRRFNLTPQFKESENRLLGDEIMKEGGFWQVDFGSIATVNLPKESAIDLDKIFKVFNFAPIEIIK